MFDPPAWLWIACTIAAAAVQTLRNAMQRSLTERVGTVGATHVRFLFGLPFGLLFLAGMAWVTDLSRLQLSWVFVAWASMGGVFQILGTGLMLAAMRERSFVVSIAYVKTEPVQIALFGLVFLGERLGLLASAAVIVATVGVLLMSMPAASVARGKAPADAGTAGPDSAAGRGSARGASAAVRASTPASGRYRRSSRPAPARHPTGRGHAGPAQTATCRETRPGPESRRPR